MRTTYLKLLNLILKNLKIEVLYIKLNNQKRKRNNIPMHSTKEAITQALLQKTLRDIIKGSRNPKITNMKKYINSVKPEIKNELKDNDMNVKSTALQKLIFVNPKSLHF